MDATEAKEEDAVDGGCGNEMSIWASRRRRKRAALPLSFVTYNADGQKDGGTETDMRVSGLWSR